MTVLFNVLIFWHFHILLGNPCLFFNYQYKMFLGVLLAVVQTVNVILQLEKMPAGLLL